MTSEVAEGDFTPGSLGGVEFDTGAFTGHRSFTIPAGAAYVRLAATADIYYSFSGNAAVPGDVDDGSACELIKQQGGAEFLIIPPGATALSVISAGTPIVTASFYTV